MPAGHIRRLAFVRCASAVGLISFLAQTLVACSVPASPATPLFGAYFPSWLICAGAGVLGAVIIRIILIKLGIDAILSWRLLVYTCIAAAIGFALALAIYGR